VGLGIAGSASRLLERRTLGSINDELLHKSTEYEPATLTTRIKSSARTCMVVLYDPVLPDPHDGRAVS
jgi:hypothetical protein